LEGPQITSLLEILSSVSSGLLTADGAVALIAVSFPQLAAEQIQSIVSGVAATVQPLPLPATEQTDVSAIA
jgi:hypothetical protein